MAACDEPGGEAFRACAEAIAPLAAVASGRAERGALLALAAACASAEPAVVELAVEASEEGDRGLQGLAALVLERVPEEAWRLALLRLELVPAHPDVRVEVPEARRAAILARHLGR